MPKTPIALPRGLRGLKSSPKQQKTVKNMIYSADDSERLILRPCVYNLLELDGACRGLGLFNNQTTGAEEMYGVFGSKLYKILITNPVAGKRLTSGDILTEEIGTIPSFSECILKSDFTYMVILIKGGASYSYDGTTLAEITSANYKPSVSLSRDDGRFIWIPADGSPFFWSDVGDPTSIQVDSRADAETQTDPNKACFVRKGINYVLGTRSIEATEYREAAQAYLRLSQDDSNTGYIGGLTEYGESFAFLGCNAQGGFDFFVMDDKPRVMSNPAVSEILNSDYFLNELDDVRGFYFVWKGTPVLIFSLPRHTFAFYADWATWHTGVKGQESATWRVNASQYAYGYIWTGDSVDGSLGNLVDSSKEFGSPVEGLIQFGIDGLPQQNFLITKIHAQMTAGNDPHARVSLSISSDGEVFGNEIYKDLGKQGHYNNHLVWGPPVARFPDYAGIRLRFYGDIIVNADGIAYE